MSDKSARPNVVVLLASQWRAKACGYAGDPNAKTPNLDCLAKVSANFREAVTPHPFGVFGRSAFLTGKFTENIGIRDYYDTLPEGERTIADRFEEAGYQTSFFGKWQLYERDPSAPVVGEEHAKVVVPENRRGGFSFWEGFESGFLLNDCYFHGSRLPEPVQISGYQAKVIFDRFSSYRLEARNEDRPQFSVLSFDAPHPPYAAPANGVERYDEADLQLLDNVSEDLSVRETARRELAGYYAHIEAMDGLIGEFVDELKLSGEWENTILVVSSVHGDLHGSHGYFRKGWPYDEAICVPLLMSWPNRISAQQNDALISLVDLGPSLFGLLGLRWRDGDGSDLSSSIVSNDPGPKKQMISMPSVPPFEKQCPFPWNAERTVNGTEVHSSDENYPSFSIKRNA